MSLGFRRSVANYLCDVLRIILPESCARWADALRAEVALIPRDGEALRFAFGGFCGLAPRIVLAHAQAAFSTLSGSDRPVGDTTAMGSSFNIFHHPRLVGVLSAVIAVILGVAYMAAAGAPLVFPALNLGALIIGLVVLALSVRIAPLTGRLAGIGVLAMGVLLLVTSVFGGSFEGARRWLVIGPFFVQTSLLFLPVMIVNFARTRNTLATAGMVAAAFAIALQPDRAMAGALVAGLFGCALHRSDRFVGVALLTAVVAFVVTLLRADTLPAVPYVDKVLYTAFDAHLFAGVAVLVGSALLLAPASIARVKNSAEPMVYIVFGLIWFSVILAAAIGNYPTPVVGYGSSAIIGYILSLSALPKHALFRSRVAVEGADAQTQKRPQDLKRVTLLSVAGLITLGQSGAAGGETIADCVRPKVEKVEIPDTVWRPGPEGEQIPLWPDDVDLQLPDYDGNPEMIGSGSPLIAGRTWNWATYIARPTITLYPPKAENTGAALLVLPGGGYRAVAMDLEGTEICDWITQRGVSCVILKYRTPQGWRKNENGVGERPDVLFALHDAQRAMGLLRHRAANYNIDTDKIGVIGFSAGAHLAADVSNIHERAYDHVDAADQEPSRPDFSVVMYPGRFLPERRPETDLKLAPWMTISADAPPTLLIHAMNDNVNDIRHSMAYGMALNDAGAPVDMRFYAKGCHAFGLRATPDPITTQWPDQVVQWLRNIGVL